MDLFLQAAIKENSILKEFKEYLISLNEKHTAGLEFLHSFDVANNDKEQIRKLAILVGYFTFVKFEKMSYLKPNMDSMVQDSFFWFVENIKSAKSSQDILKSLVFSIVINSQGFEITNSLENIQSSFEIASSLLSDRDLLEFCRLTSNRKFAIYKQIFLKVNNGRVTALTTISTTNAVNEQSFDVLFKSNNQKSHATSSDFVWGIENCRIILSIIFSKLDVPIATEKECLSPYESYISMKYDIQRLKLMGQIYDIFKNIVSLSGCNYLYMIPLVQGSEIYGICPLSLSNSLCLDCNEHSEAQTSNIDLSKLDLVLKIALRLNSATQNDVTQSVLTFTLKDEKLEVDFANYSKSSLENRKKETLGTQSIEMANFRDKALQTYEKVENTCNTSYCKSTVMLFRTPYYSTRKEVFK